MTTQSSTNAIQIDPNKVIQSLLRQMSELHERIAFLEAALDGDEDKKKATS